MLDAAGRGDAVLMKKIAGTIKDGPYKGQWYDRCGFVSPFPGWANVLLEGRVRREIPIGYLEDIPVNVSDEITDADGDLEGQADLEAI